MSANHSISPLTGGNPHIWLHGRGRHWQLAQIGMGEGFMFLKPLQSKTKPWKINRVVPTLHKSRLYTKNCSSNKGNIL